MGVTKPLTVGQRFAICSLLTAPPPPKELSNQPLSLAPAPSPVQPYPGSGRCWFQPTSSSRLATHAIDVDRRASSAQVDPQKFRFARCRFALHHPDRSPSHAKKESEHHRRQRPQSAKHSDAGQQAIRLLHLGMELQRHRFIPRQLIAQMNVLHYLLCVCGLPRSSR